MNFDDTDLYAGISGARLPTERFDLGEGVTLTRTYAHLMARFMMAFAPAPEGGHHPGPWKPAEGGFGFDIVVQLHIPKDFDTSEWFDKLNTVWWLVALVRFRSSHSVVAPVVTKEAFDRAAEADHIRFWPVEIEPYRLQLAVNPSILLESDLTWIRDHWRRAGKLMRESKLFILLFRSFDQSLFTRNPSLALLTLWAALEPMFSPARSELRFRISSNIAAYLERPGRGRHDLYKQVAKLYDARSNVAHGTSQASQQSLTDTYDVAKRILEKIIEADHVPTREELEGNVFGSDAD